MISPGVQLSGRYRLDERIAGGGMGDVWRGTDEVLGRTVAVKILLPALLEEPNFVERFRGEARTMASINHQGVVDVYDYGTDDATAYLVMEYVEGDALATTLSRVGRLTPARTMALVAQAADALHAAHGKGIVHRDVKPGNLLVRPNGTLVLTDFGIARSALVGQLTAVGSVLGTASYISPEQASGATATPASDVYSLGVVAYQCLAGRRPFEGDNPLEIAMRHVREIPPPLPADTPPAIRAIVDRAMAKDPKARWASAAQMAAVARQAATTLSTSQAAAPAGRMTAPVPGGRPASPARPVASASMMRSGSAAPVARPAPAPAGARPTSPPAGGRPASPAPMAPGQPYPRGAASVSPAAVSPGQPRPMPQSYPYLPPVAAAPGTSSPNGWIILLAVIVAVTIVLCSGAIAYEYARKQNDDGGNYNGALADTGMGACMLVVAGGVVPERVDGIRCGSIAIGDHHD